MSPQTASPVLQVLANERPSRHPVWFMRQAGRCLPEYRELRKQHGFLDLLRDVDLATRVTLMPMERFDLDAAILFTDLLVPLEAMGVGLEYTPGPEMAWTVESRADLDRLQPLDAEHALAVPLETARRVRAELPPERALLGFVGAPWTLAAYLVEGKGSKVWSKLRALAWRDEETITLILDRLADAAVSFGLALGRAGCDAIQVFDSWAGVADPGEFHRLVAPAVKRVVAALQAAGLPVIYFVNGAGPLLASMIETGADCLGVDWRTDIAAIHAAMPAQMAIQGNLDPIALFGSDERIETETRRICAAVADRPHIFNVGHGLDPKTPISGIERVIQTLRRLDD